MSRKGKMKATCDLSTGINFLMNSHGSLIIDEYDEVEEFKLPHNVYVTSQVAPGELLVTNNNLQDEVHANPNKHKYCWGKHQPMGDVMPNIQFKSLYVEGDEVWGNTRSGLIIINKKDILFEPATPPRGLRKNDRALLDLDKYEEENPDEEDALTLKDLIKEWTQPLYKKKDYTIHLLTCMADPRLSYSEDEDEDEDEDDSEFWWCSQCGPHGPHIKNYRYHKIGEDTDLCQMCYDTVPPFGKDEYRVFPVREQGYGINIKKSRKNTKKIKNIKKYLKKLTKIRRKSRKGKGNKVSLTEDERDKIPSIIQQRSCNLLLEHPKILKIFNKAFIRS